MNKYFLFLLFFFNSIISSYSLASDDTRQFFNNISVNRVCGPDDKLINFNNSFHPAIEVQFSKSPPDPDLTIKVVEYEFLADIVIKDNKGNLRNKDNLNFSVCASKKSLADFTIKVTKYSADPDVVVKLSENNLDYDFKVFYSSSIISLEEAIALLFLPNYLIIK